MFNCAANSSVKMGPSEKYPYGIEKLKNIAVLIPSTLFIFLGLELIVETALSFLEAHEVAAGTFSVNSTIVRIFIQEINLRFFMLISKLITVICCEYRCRDVYYSQKLNGRD